MKSVFYSFESESESAVRTLTWLGSSKIWRMWRSSSAQSESPQACEETQAQAPASEAHRRLRLEVGRIRTRRLQRCRKMVLKFR